MSSDAPICISGRPGSASVSTQASSEKTGSAGADTQALRKSTRQADKSGSYGAGPSAPTKRHPSTEVTGSKTSPKSQAPTVSARSGSTARRSARLSEKLLLEDGSFGGSFVALSQTLRNCFGYVSSANLR